MEERFLVVERGSESREFLVSNLGYPVQVLTGDDYEITEEGDLKLRDDFQIVPGSRIYIIESDNNKEYINVVGMCMELEANYFIDKKRKRGIGGL